MSAFGRFLPVEAVRRTSALDVTASEAEEGHGRKNGAKRHVKHLTETPYPFMLWLCQRHAFKAFRASVGDEEGHKADCILAGLACGKQIEK